MKLSHSHSVSATRFPARKNISMFYRGLAHASVVTLLMFASSVAHSSEARGLSENLSQGLSGAAALSFVGSATVVGGSIAAVASTGQFVVQSVSTVGEGSVVVLKAVGEGASTVATGSAELSLNISSAALAGASVVVGTGLSIIRETAGWAIRCSCGCGSCGGGSDGKLVGYIVNDSGAALLRQQKLS